MSRTNDILNQRLADRRMNSDFGAFNPDAITATQMNKLRNDVYGGYKTKDVPKYAMRGAGSGRRNVQTGYQSVFNGDYYKNHAGWSAIGGKLGISNINSENDARQLYDFVNRYQPPAAQAAAYAPSPTGQLGNSGAFEARLQQIQAANKAQTDGLMQQMAADRKNYEDLTSKYEKSISGYQKAFNQGSSVGGQESSLMINPAESKATKTKKTSKGTSQFNRNLKISNVSI